MGVFSESSLFSYFCSDEIIDAGDDLMIKDIMDFCTQEVGSQTFKIIKPSTSLERIHNIFTAIESPTQRVGSLFVTPSGKPEDIITGMLTPWDILTNIVD